MAVSNFKDKMESGLNLRIMGYSNVILNLKSALEILYYDDYQEKIPLFESVRLSVPKDINLYGGSLAVIKTRKVPEIKQLSLGGHIGKVEAAIIQGAIFSFVKGADDDAVIKTLNYADMVGALLKVKGILKDPTATISPLKSDTQNWEAINITGNPKMPRWYSFAVTGFQITKIPEKELVKQVYF